MRFRPTEVVSADELESIHDASLRILSEIGMNFLDAGSRERLAAAGATVDGERVRFDPAMVVEVIRTCPAEFRLHSWNPAHTLTIGGDHIAFGSVGSPPNIVGLDGVRRPGTREAFRDLLKLCQIVRGRPLPRRLPGRADRRALVGPPPRGGTRPADVHRQGAAHLQPRRASATATCWR